VRGDGILIIIISINVSSITVIKVQLTGRRTKKMHGNLPLMQIL